MNTSHTPGPWLIAESDKRFVYALNDKGINRFCALVQDAHTNIAELEANARLIAAAPELLAAIENIIKSLSDADDEGMIEHAEQMVAARSAIAKATGETA